MDFGAIEALVGVVVGGAISTGTTLGLERRRERQAREREIGQQRAELRVAARLIRDELLHAQSELEGIGIYGAWPAEEIPTEAWRLHAPVLARHMRFDWWASLTVAYGRIQERNLQMRHQRTLPLNEHDWEQIDDDLEEIRHLPDHMMLLANDLPAAEEYRRKVYADLGIETHSRAA